MRFINRDFTNQFISSSYQDVLQQYIPTGSTLFVLDGIGNVVFSIPSASYGYGIITSDQTSSIIVASASYVVSASYAATSSWTINSINSISSSWSSESVSSSYSLTSSYALNAATSSLTTGSTYPITSSWAETASYSIYSISSSFATSASYEIIYETSSSYAETSSWAIDSISSISASWASSSLSSSYSETSKTSSYTVYSSTTIISINNTTTSLFQQPNTIYSGIFLNYIVKDGVNYRAGNIVTVYNTESVKHNETTTTDIGDSTGLNLSAVMSGSYVEVIVVNNTINNFDVKYHYEIL